MATLVDHLQRLRLVFAKHLRRGFLAAVLALEPNSAAWGQGLACQYQISDVIQAPSCGVLGPPPTVPLAMSPNGRFVVGYYARCVTDGNEAFIYDRLSKTLHTIPRPAGEYTSEARDVNDAGVAVGSFGGPSATRSFVYDYPSQQYTAFLTAAVPGICWATGINNRGQVCGWRGTTGPVNATTAFRWGLAAGFVDLGLINGASTTGNDINSTGSITGAMRVANVSHAFIWRANGDLIDLGSPSGLSSHGRAINDMEIVAGSDVVPLPHWPFEVGRAVLWDGTKSMTLNPLPGFLASGTADIASSGLVVGTSSVPTSGASFSATVWSGSVPHDLDDLAPLEDFTTLWSVVSSSTSGILVADVNDGEFDEVAVALTPQRVSGDADANCIVNVNDLLAVIAHWGNTWSPSDVTGDGIVNQFDVVAVVSNWTF